MTEAELIAWAKQNWPSIVMSLIMTVAYLRLHRLIERLNRTEKSVKRVLKVCGKMHPDKGQELFNGDNEED